MLPGQNPVLGLPAHLAYDMHRSLSRCTLSSVSHNRHGTVLYSLAVCTLRFTLRQCHSNKCFVFVLVFLLWKTLTISTLLQKLFENEAKWFIRHHSLCRAQDGCTGYVMKLLQPSHLVHQLFQWDIYTEARWEFLFDSMHCETPPQKSFWVHILYKGTDNVVWDKEVLINF